MDILMPQPGETVAEAVITSWSKSVGDTVAVGDVLFEIDTDKAAMEVPASAAGILSEIRVAAGETVAVSAVVAVLTTAGESPPAAPAAPPPAPAPAAVEREPYNFVRTPDRNFGPAELANGVKVTPLARRLASAHGIDLLAIVGSGPRGRIVGKDVQAHPAPVEAPPPSAPPPAPPPAPPGNAVAALYAGVAYTEVALDGMRRAIARRLVESKQTVPHFYLTAEVSIDRLLALRQEVNARRDSRISVNDFVVRAFALALHREPEANAVWAENRILRFAHVDVGVAVSVEGGLFTPIVRKAETKSLAMISAEIRELADKARDRRLTPADYQGGAAAVSNLGMYGVQQFQAIINPPNATILAVGAGERRPAEAPDGGVVFESRMTVTLSVDHRVIDGALGARLLAAFKAIVEDPLTMLI